jgi:tetratricopeptide (TPR) repeat protein
MIRPVAWLGVLLQLASIAALTWVLVRFLGVREPTVAFFVSAVAHAVYSRIMRAMLIADHRRGVKLIRAGRYAEATPYFEASYNALVRRPWIDRYRWLLLGSASAMPYREMALCNAAFCYGQTGDGQRAIELYERALQEFPDSGLASASLKMLRSITPPTAKS